MNEAQGISLPEITTETCERPNPVVFQSLGEAEVTQQFFLQA